MAEEKREKWNPLLCNYPDSDKVNEVSFQAETMFTRLLALCDDGANYHADSTLLMCGLFAKRFKKRQISVTKAARWRDELAAKKLIILYKSEDKLYLHINSCKKCLRSDIKPDIRFPKFTQPLNIKELPESVTKTERTRNENGSSDSTTDSTTDKDIYGIFEQARIIYPGTKRGCSTELNDFQRKHKDWRDALPLLKPAIERQITSRSAMAKKGDFVPPWKHFKTWLYNRCWEEEPEKQNRPIQETTRPMVQVQCVVDQKSARCYSNDKKGKAIWLCQQCAKAFEKNTGHKNWGYMSLPKIEKLVLEGKVKREKDVN